MDARPHTLGFLTSAVALLLACGDDPVEGPADASADVGFDAGDAAERQDANVPPVDGGAPEDGGAMNGLGTWSTLAPMPNGPRQETSVVALGDEIYVLGGFDESAQVLSLVEAYAPSTDTWRDRAALPFALHHMNAAAVDGAIYVVGGLTGLGFVQNPNILRYDPVADRWDGLGEMPAGTDRGSAGVCVLGTKIYLAGGYRAGAAQRIFSAYDTRSGQFESLPELPGPLDHLAAACIGDRVYVIGGRNRSITAMTAEVWAFDPTLGAWNARAPLPRPRGGFAGAAVLGAQIYVFGGEGNQDPGQQGVFADADVYDPGSDRWFMLAPMRTPRHGTAAAALGNRIYVPGGATRQAFGAVDVHEAFSPGEP